MRGGEAVVIAKENLEDLANLLAQDSSMVSNPDFRDQVAALKDGTAGISDLMGIPFLLGLDELCDACGLIN